MNIKGRNNKTKMGVTTGDSLSVGDSLKVTNVGTSIDVGICKKFSSKHSATTCGIFIMLDKLVRKW